MKASFGGHVLGELRSSRLTHVGGLGVQDVGQRSAAPDGRGAPQVNLATSGSPVVTASRSKARAIGSPVRIAASTRPRSWER